MSDLIQLRNDDFIEAQHYLQSKKFTLDGIWVGDSPKKRISFLSTDTIFQRVTLVYDSLDKKPTFVTLSCEFNQFSLLKQEIGAKNLNDISNSIKSTDKYNSTKKLYVYQDKGSIFEFKVFGAFPDADMFKVTICDILNYEKL